MVVFFIILFSGILPVSLLYTYWLGFFSPPLELLIPYAPGIWLYYLFLLQLVLGSRPQLLERSVGLPVLLRFHVFLNIPLMILLIIHTVQRLDLNKLTALSTISGATPLVVTIVLILLALFKWLPGPLQRGRPGHYVTMRALHALFIGVIIIAAVHLLLSGAHEYNPAGNILVTVPLITVLIHYACYKVTSLRGRYRGQVSKVEHLNDNLFNITLRCKEEFTFIAGQFAFLRFDLSPREEHPFSYCNPPGENEGVVTVKSAGDYTRLLKETLKVGTQVRISRPYGRFVIDELHHRHYLLFAGGIGITPFMSILQQIDRQQNRDGLGETTFDLFWMCINEEDFVFIETLKSLSLPSLRLYLLCDKRGEFFNGTLLDQVMEGKDRKQTGSYICAPSGLSRTIKSELKRLGIRPIHYEAFSF